MYKAAAKSFSAQNAGYPRRISVEDDLDLMYHHRDCNKNPVTLEEVAVSMGIQQVPFRPKDVCALIVEPAADALRKVPYNYAKFAICSIIELARKTKIKRYPWLAQMWGDRQCFRLHSGPYRICFRRHGKNILIFRVRGRNPG
jgi:hypothetical protein